MVSILGERPYGMTKSSHDALADKLILEAEERIIKDENRKD
jgi:hypothetical protein